MRPEFLKPMCFLISGILLLFACGESASESKPVSKTEKMETTESEEPVESEYLSPEEDFAEEAWTEVKDPDFIKLIMDEEVKTDKRAKANYKNQYIDFRIKDDPYTVYFAIRAKDDFNDDHIPDYIVFRNSEGMLGGNINTNSSMIYCIMGNNNKILQKHEVLLNAPFSYNIIDRISYKKNKLTARVIQNYRTYMPENAADLKTTTVNFIYKDSNLYEESYLSECELAKWKNKKLFNQHSEVNRSIEMHNYTEEVHEKFSNGEFDFSADFSGCDNLHLVLEARFGYSGKKQAFLIEKRDRFLNYLKENTTLSTEIGAIESYFADTNSSEEAVELDGFTFRLFTSHEKGKTIFRLVLDQTKNPKQTENWEITTRTSRD